MGHDKRFDPRLERQQAPSQRHWEQLPERTASAMEANAVVDCGWGRLLFAHTFEDPHSLAGRLREEGPGRRDIAFYVRDPHVVVSLAPQELFLDPSHTYRLWFDQYKASPHRPRGFRVRAIQNRRDAEVMREIYLKRGMVPADPDFVCERVASPVITWFVAEDTETGELIGTVMGVDHGTAFGDPEKGSSLWCLAVDPQAKHAGVGEQLVRQLAEHYFARGRAFMDLSVMHDNTQAIALYEKLGFRRVPAFTVKTKSSINEALFTGTASDGDLNPYARIIVKEARRRGIHVDILDDENGYFALTWGGRTIVCRESLSELTTAVAMSRCDDKVVTHRVLRKAGLRMPKQRLAGTPEDSAEFLAECGSLVVKPRRGEQGRGVFVDIGTVEEVDRAVLEAKKICDDVLLEEFVTGQDLRIIVIDYKVVAAAVRKPAEITGTGRHMIRELIEKQSRRRQAATGGESSIPLDDETERCVATAKYGLEDVLPAGERLTVRKTANLHTGGTIHDVTDTLHHELAEAAVKAAHAISIPVVGFDFMVPRVDRPEYVIIEANERPGLANHEPQPTAERFLDFLFPHSGLVATTRELGRPRQADTES